MDKTILTLGVDTSQVVTASEALQRMAASGNAAEASAQKLSFAAVAQGKALGSTIVQANKSASAVGALANSTNQVKPNALALVADRLGYTTSQATKAAAAIQSVNRAIGSTPQFKTTIAAPSAALQASAPIAAIGAQRFVVPTGIAQMGRDAAQAQSNVDRLTASAITQRSALAQLSPAAQSAAASYRQLALSPISNLPRPVNPVPPGAIPAVKGMTQAQKDLAKTTRQATFQNQQLAFQLNDFAVQVVSGGNPLIALVQQGSQLSGTYGGIGNAVKAVTGLLTPARLAFGGAAAAVGVLAYQFNEAQKQGHAFASAVLLSGNAAGQTEGKVNALAQMVSRQTQATASNVREMAQALISSGQIVPQVFDQATKAAVVYQQATGKTAEEVAKDFAQMAQAPTQFAAKLGAVSLEQYKAIKALEDGGDAVGAATVLYGALADKADEVNKNLPFFSERVRFLSRDFDNLGIALRGVFNPTTEQQIAKVQARIAALRSGGSMDWRNLFGLDNSGAIAEAEGKLGELTAKQKAEQEKANKDAVGQRAKTAAASLQPLLDRANPQQVFEREKAKRQQEFKALAAAGTPLSAADQKTIIDQLRKQILPAKSSGGGGGFSAASQALRAQLDNDLDGIVQVFEREREAIAFQNQFLQGEYQAGNVSLKAFYDEKRRLAEQEATAEVDSLEKERTRLQQQLKVEKDPTERTQINSRIGQIDGDIERVKLNASRDVQLANQEEAASYKALDEQVNNYRASLLDLAGDEDGAAKIRTASALAAARQLSQQSGGKISEADVNAMARLSVQQQAFNTLQREASILSQNAARAEDAYVLAAEQHGKSLVETERGVVRIRTEELAQLGELTRKAQELAKVSTDPRIKQFAADLALEYAKAADAIDPALNRLRDANRELAAGLAGTITNFPTAFADAYKQRQSAANDDVRKQKDEYSRRIDQLRGYLAETQDMQDKAKLRAEIKGLEGERAAVKGKSGSSNAFGAFKDAVLAPVGAQVFASFSKVLIQDPLQKMLENQLKGMTEGGGFLAGFFKDALGIKDDPKLIAEQQQTASITASTQALDLLTRAAQSAAGAVQATPGSPALPVGTIPVDGDLAGVTDEAAGATENLGTNALSAASDLTRFAASAGIGGEAMGRLPGIIGLFQSAVAMMSLSGGKSGDGIGSIFGAILGAFAGGGSAASAGSSMIASAFGGREYHRGGIVGPSTGASRVIASATLANATRYHSGGIAGKQADKLRPNEVPAILMGGPKGKREEVLIAEDPRHRDNLGMNALARIMKESRHQGLRAKGARELGGPVSANSMYRVNEKKRPELLEVAGKQYLMTGAQGGKVTDPGAGPRGGDTNITVNVAPPQGATRSTAQQFGANAAREMQRALSRN